MNYPAISQFGGCGDLNQIHCAHPHWGPTSCYENFIVRGDLVDRKGQIIHLSYLFSKAESVSYKAFNVHYLCSGRQ